MRAKKPSRQEMSRARRLDQGLEQEYESASGFAEAFGKRFGVPPGQARGVVEVRLRTLESPVGPLQIGASPRGVCMLEFQDRGCLPRELERLRKHFGAPAIPGSHPHLDALEEQLGEYFSGRRQEFSVPLDLVGTPFQRAVWEELCRIPFGETLSYGALAARVGRPGGARAVGRANGSNCVAIVVPCHRVVQADGQLRGYGGGLWRKQALLDLERRTILATEN